MADHAGFAGAVTIREHVLKTALLTAYANGSFPTVLAGDLPGGSPSVTAGLFLGQPDINCEGGANLIVLKLPTWGTLQVTLNETIHTVGILGELVATFSPVFVKADARSVELAPDTDDIRVRSWTASVTTPGTPADVTAYVIGDSFRSRLEQAIRLAIAFGQFSLPTLDVSFFGPLVREATSVEARVRSGVLLLGFNVEDETNTIVGDVNQLTDFARTNDVAGIVNAAAASLLLKDLHTQLVDAVTAQQATLDHFEVHPSAGYFQVSGAVTDKNGSATIRFSFRLVPGMFHTRPGKYFNYLPKPRRVYSRTWPALEFRIENVETDVDRAWWLVVLEIFLGVLTLGFAAFQIEGMISAADNNFSGRLRAAGSGATARVQRTIPPPGGVGVRIGLDQFEVTADGTFIGISIQEKASPVALLGPSKVPITYSNDDLKYTLRLPSGLFETDPALRVHWTVVDQTNNTTVMDDDGPVSGRLSVNFLPAAYANAVDFSISARLYRQVGPIVTELEIASLNLKIREALPPGAYIRWRSEVSNPQVALNKVSEEWSYLGEVRVRRWSEWHRTDSPCLAVNANNRYRFSHETADRLPFPLRLLESHRKGLCPYCFYGGPGGTNPAL